MSLEFYHDVDDEVVEYLKGRIPRWNSTLQTINDSQRIRFNLHEEEFIPVFFKYSNVHERQKIVEEILSEEGEVYTPVILVEPLQPNILDDMVVYTDPDKEYDNQSETVTLRKGKRRIGFNYQIEGVTKRWSDYRILQSWFNFRLFPRDAAQDYIELFNQTYTIIRETPQRVVEEESNLFRYIFSIGIEMDLYTLPDEVVESVEEVIVNVAQS